MECAFEQKGRYMFMELKVYVLKEYTMLRIYEDPINKTYKNKSTHVKIVNSNQAHIHQYQNVKRKLYNCNANIFLNAFETI